MGERRSLSDIPLVERLPPYSRQLSRIALTNLSSLRLRCALANRPERYDQSRPIQIVGFLAGPLRPFQGVFSVWPALPRLRRNLLLGIGAMPGPAWQILKPLPSTPGSFVGASTNSRRPQHCFEA